MRRTLDPKLDIVFKLLFADERNTALLVSLLTAILKPAHPITEAVLLNPEIERSAVLEKGAVLDVRVRLKDGVQVDIEMQAAPQRAFLSRGLFYWAKLYSSQLSRGEEHLALRPAVSVFILDFVALETQSLHSTFRLLEIHEQTPLTTDLELDFIELPKLRKGAAGMDAAVLRWAQFLAADSDETLEQLAVTDPDIARAKQALERLSNDPKAQELAWERQMAAWNYEMNLRLEREEGEQCGFRKGSEATLREAIVALCEALEISVTEDREQTLACLSLNELKALQRAVVAERRWPD